MTTTAHHVTAPLYDYQCSDGSVDRTKLRRTYTQHGGTSQVHLC